MSVGSRPSEFVALAIEEDERSQTATKNKPLRYQIEGIVLLKEELDGETARRLAQGRVENVCCDSVDLAGHRCGTLP